MQHVSVAKKWGLADSGEEVTQHVSVARKEVVAKKWGLADSAHVSVAEWGLADSAACECGEEVGLADSAAV